MTVSHQKYLLLKHDLNFMSFRHDIDTMIYDIMSFVENILFIYFLNIFISFQYQSIIKPSNCATSVEIILLNLLNPNGLSIVLIKNLFYGHPTIGEIKSRNHRQSGCIKSNNKGIDFKLQSQEGAFPLHKLIILCK